MKKVYIQPFTYCHIIKIESQILAGTQKGDASENHGGGASGTEHQPNGGNTPVIGTGGETDPDDWDQG
ncbi:MAG: hypothetical protein MJZ32_08580 [Bacteroidaceae bacterium]|nr:hypothetical protein [Bacteroidaceae bacterium]